MKSTDIIQPTAIQTPFSINGDKNIPSQNAGSSDTSSINLGFLPITSEPLDDGGIAPERTDFNGMFYLSTDQRVFLQNGGVITYDATVATKIRGYPQGAILGYINNGSYGFVESLVDDNQNNFVADSTNIDGVNWRYIPITNTIETIKMIYPVGSIYIGMTQNCPLSALFGTWELITEGLTLQQADTSHPIGTEIPAGLPDHTHFLSRKYGDASPTTAERGYFSSESNTATRLPMASKYNSIYGSSDTVQPPALAVNIWRRTA